MSTSASKLFREACGLKAPLTLECAGPGRSHDRRSPYRRDEPFALLGRDGCSDLVLDDPQVSRRHAFLQAIEGRVFCFDLESRTKLIWEGEVSPRPGGWLEPGREIKVGPYAIRWTTPETSGGGEPVSQDPLGPEELEPGRTAPMPQAGLELPIRAGKEKSSWWLEGRMGFVGRSETCQLVLSEASVSRFHAALIRTSVGVWVVDLWAREGTLVNDLKVRWAWLDEGDTLRIGRFLFVVRYKAPPEGISRRLVPLDAGAILETSQGESPSDTTPGQRRTLATRPKVRPAPPSGPQGTIPSATVVLAREPFFEPELQARIATYGDMAAADADDGVVP